MVSTKQTTSIAINLLLSLGLVVTPHLVNQADAQTPLLARLQTRSPGSRIQVRSAPSVQAPAVTFGKAGDTIQLLDETQGSDGYIWYYVKLDTSNREGWVRGDLVKFAVQPLDFREKSNPNGVGVQFTGYLPPTLPPTTSLPNTSLPNTRSATPQVAYRTAPASSYSAEVMNYFLEVALGGEYGRGDARIRKWTGSVRIQVHGSPSQEDWQTLQRVISEINGLVSQVQLELTDMNPNLHIYFIPESQFHRYEPNYQPTNYGFFWVTSPNHVIQKANVMISTTGVTQQERSHLIREELTQSLGLMKDSRKYRKSIFYQGWTDQTEYSDADRRLIQLLYHPQIRPGMTRAQVMQVLTSVAQFR